jgi:hypothetical protein
MAPFFAHKTSHHMMLYHSCMQKMVHMMDFVSWYCDNQSQSYGIYKVENDSRRAKKATTLTLLSSGIYNQSANGAAPDVCKKFIGRLLRLCVSVTYMGCYFCHTSRSNIKRN